jgi:hypothetical protein
MSGARAHLKSPLLTATQRCAHRAIGGSLQESGTCLTGLCTPVGLSRNTSRSANTALADFGAATLDQNAQNDDEQHSGNDADQSYLVHLESPCVSTSRFSCVLRFGERIAAAPEGLTQSQCITTGSGSGTNSRYRCKELSICLSEPWCGGAERERRARRRTARKQQRESM